MITKEKFLECENFILGCFMYGAIMYYLQTIKEMPTEKVFLYVLLLAVIIGSIKGIIKSILIRKQ